MADAILGPELANPNRRQSIPQANDPVRKPLPQVKGLKSPPREGFKLNVHVDTAALKGASGIDVIETV